MDFWDVIDAARSFSFAGLPRYGICLLTLLRDPLRVREVATLASQGSQIRRQDSQHQRFDIVHHRGVLDCVPTKVIPEMFAPSVPTRSFNPRPDISFSDVHQH
jgi:hypothetical protein